MTPMNVTTARAVEDEYKELIATNFAGLAGFVVLLYDHVLTFDDEVQYIWLCKKRLVAWLFLLNRYITPLGFAINIYAYISPVWTPLVCEHFVRYEGAMTYIGLTIAAFIMAIRVAGIYHDNRSVLVLLGLIYMAVTGVFAWLLSTAGPVHHSAGIHGCTMIFGQTVSVGNWASAAVWLLLLYDTAVVLLVVWRTRTFIKVTGQSQLVSALVKDGLVYYSAILGTNLALAIMIDKAPNGVKNILGQFELLFTVLLMSRITLNLRKYMEHPHISNYESHILLETYPTGNIA